MARAGTACRGASEKENDQLRNNIPRQQCKLSGGAHRTARLAVGRTVGTKSSSQQRQLGTEASVLARQHETQTTLWPVRRRPGRVHCWLRAARQAASCPERDPKVCREVCKPQVAGRRPPGGTCLCGNQRVYSAKGSRPDGEWPLRYRSNAGRPRSAKPCILLDKDARRQPVRTLKNARTRRRREGALR